MHINFENIRICEYQISKIMHYFCLLLPVYCQQKFSDHMHPCRPLPSGYAYRHLNRGGMTGGKFREGKSPGSNSAMEASEHARWLVGGDSVPPSVKLGYSVHRLSDVATPASSLSLLYLVPSHSPRRHFTQDKRSPRTSGGVV